MDTADKASSLIPEEFVPLAENPESITHRLAERFQVSPLSFINWRWQMKHQIIEAAQAETVIRRCV